MRQIHVCPFIWHMQQTDVLFCTEHLNITSSFMLRTFVFYVQTSLASFSEMSSSVIWYFCSFYTFKLSLGRMISFAWYYKMMISLVSTGFGIIVISHRNIERICYWISSMLFFSENKLWQWSSWVILQEILIS